MRIAPGRPPGLHSSSPKNKRRTVGDELPMRTAAVRGPVGVPHTSRAAAGPRGNSNPHEFDRRPGVSLTGGKKKCSGTSFPKKARGHSMCSTMVGRLRLAVGNWRLVAVGGGWRRLVAGGWWLEAVGSGWQLAVGRRWRLAAVGGWRLVAVGGWQLVVVGG